MAELCLGTAQFGMKYGINNQEGKPTEEECFRMLDIALEHGIRVIDTARAYGTAELVLGKYLRYRKHKVDIISKLRPNIIETGTYDVYSVIRKEVEESMERLGVSYLKGYLLHTPEYVYNERIVEAMFRLKEEKLVQNIGVSIYGIEEGREAIKKGMDYVQLPYSILDQRGKQSGFLEEAAAAGVKIFTRSAFLQGLILMNKEQIPKQLQDALVCIRKFEEITDKYGEERIKTLIHFVTEEETIDYLVFGVDNTRQLEENMKAHQEPMMKSALLDELKTSIHELGKEIILPSLWANGKRAK